MCGTVRAGANATVADQPEVRGKPRLGGKRCMAGRGVPRQNGRKSEHTEQCECAGGPDADR